MFTVVAAPRNPLWKVWMVTPRVAVFLHSSKNFNKIFQTQYLPFQWCWYWRPGVWLVFPGKCWASWKPHRELLWRCCLVSCWWKVWRFLIQIFLPISLLLGFGLILHVLSNTRNQQVCCFKLESWLLSLTLSLSECLTTLSKKCVFPFSYNGVVHNQCTHVGSENGAAWCATQVLSTPHLHWKYNYWAQVDSEGAVVRNTWEDCQAGCPVEEQEVVLDI